MSGRSAITWSKSATAARIVLEVEVGQAAVDVGPGQIGPQRDAGAVAGDGRVELAQPDITVAEQEIVHEVLQIAPGDVLERGHDLAPLPERRGIVRAPAVIESVEDVPEAIHRRPERD